MILPRSSLISWPLAPSVAGVGPDGAPVEQDRILRTNFPLRFGSSNSETPQKGGRRVGVHFHCGHPRLARRGMRTIFSKKIG